MRLTNLGIAALAAVALAGGASADPAVTGDYVESRSANVFIGACHRESELLTAGRNAVAAWSIADGSHNGVSLKGISAVAIVAADKHLDFEDAARRTVLYVSSNASEAQRNALAGLLSERAAKSLGTIVGVKSAAVSFDGSGDSYRVEIPGTVQLKVKKATQETCCKQPYELWGRPLAGVKAFKPGYTVSVSYKDPGINASWSASEQNSAYHGQFSL